MDPVTATKIDWTGAANPLISYAPPYNTSDTISRDATARLGYRGFSASIVEEQGSLAKFFTPPPEESHHEMIDQFGMFHASADREVESEVPSDEPPGTTYADYLNSITESPGLNTWLIEEVEWSTRYCNDLDRLVTCPITGELNRENNMVDPDRWRNWMALLNHAKANGEVMTMGDYALAMQFDNAPTVPNPDQADADHDGIGDVIDDATINVVEVQVDSPASGAEATLTATLLNGSSTGIPGQTIVFFIDTDGDGTEEQHTATTDANGVASVVVTVSGGPGTVFLYRATWDGGPVNLEAAELLRVGDPVPLKIIEVNHTGSSVEFTVEGLDPLSTYRLGRSADLLGFPHTVVSGFAPAGSPDTLSDDDPPAEEAYYRLEEE